MEKSGKFRLTSLERNWILYDVGNSAFVLMVATLIPIFFNALAAADRIIIPVQAQYLSVKGVEQLLGTVARVKQNINHRLKIDGVLLAMTDSRTNNSREIASLLRKTYGSRIKVFDAEIPRSVRAAEISAEGKSIFAHDPKGKVAEAYKSLTEEVVANAERQLKRVAERGR